MKDDYLWDKSGFDPEIAAMEAKLSAFRSEAGAPPVASVAVTTPVAGGSRSWRSFWPLWIPVFAAAALVVGWLLMFGTIRRDGFQTEVTAVKPPDDARPPVAPRLPEKSNPAADPAPPPVQFTPSRPPKIVPVRASVPRMRTPVRARTDQTAPRNSSEALTSEEKFAYEQLMLALSITGSKLKIVQDKIRYGELPAAGGK